MQRLFTLLSLAALSLSLTSCLPEETVIEAPDVDGFSNSLSLEFSEGEFSKLSQDLNIDRNIELSSVAVPFHIGRSTGLERIDETSSDARKALLGRVLFYDTRLSSTGETSCASCHKQEIAFSDDVDFSKGINGQVTKRNSIALGSVPSFTPVISGYGSSADGNQARVAGTVKFFWDERAETIKEQSEATIEDEREMGQDLHALSNELKDLEMYQILTMKAFGTTDLSPDRITLALEKFTSSIVSMNTRFDQLMDAEISNNIDFSQFTASERQGQQLFNQNCSSCHGNQMGKPRVNIANNGLAETYTDKGVGDFTGSFAQDALFKVPFLRNVALTGPYMHDGSFETLREVIDHYSDGIVRHHNLSPQLQDQSGEAVRMNFSETDKQALIDFLEMTTDETVLVDPRFSDPFRQ